MSVETLPATSRPLPSMFLALRAGSAPKGLQGTERVELQRVAGCQRQAPPMPLPRQQDPAHSHILHKSIENVNL